MIRSPVKLGLQAVNVGSGKTSRDKVNTAYLINNLDLEEVSKVIDERNLLMKRLSCRGIKTVCLHMHYD